MKNIYLVLSLVITGAVFAQNPCANGRYASNVYSTITTTSNVTYGQNTSWSGSNTVLKMDIYEPQGDTATKRPLMILRRRDMFAQVLTTVWGFSRSILRMPSKQLFVLFRI